MTVFARPRALFWCLAALCISASLPAAAQAPPAPSPPALPPPPATTADGSPTWTHWRGGPLQQGRAAGRLHDTLTVRWTATVGAEIRSSAVMDDTLAYVGASDGTVRAVSRTTGEPAWTVTTTAGVEAPVLRSPTHVVVGDTAGTVFAIDPDTGAVAWQVSTGSKITASAVYDPGAAPPAATVRPPSLLVGDHAGTLHALDPATGAVRWAFETGSYLYGSPALHGDRALLGGCDGFIYQLDLATGQPAAPAPGLPDRHEVGAYIGGAIAWDPPFASVGHFGNAVLGLDTATMAATWTFRERNFPYLSSPALTDDLVVLGSRDKWVRAIERATGEVWWMFPTRGKVEASPVIVYDRVVVPSTDGRLYVASLSDGELLQTLELGPEITASPAVYDGWVVLGGHDGTVYGLGPPLAKPTKRAKAKARRDRSASAD